MANAKASLPGTLMMEQCTSSTLNWSFSQLVVMAAHTSHVPQLTLVQVMAMVWWLVQACRYKTWNSYNSTQPAFMVQVA